MKVSKITVKNYRILKNVILDLENDLSIILGKNNSGKTSLLRIMDSFLNNVQGTPKFTFDDFNLEFKKKLISAIQEENKEWETDGISLKIFIEYDDLDNLSNIGDKVIMDLDPNNTTVILGFEYCISKNDFDTLRRDINENKDNKDDIEKFLRENYHNYFQIMKKSILFDIAKDRENDNEFVDLIKEKIAIDKIISFKKIEARRDVSNKNASKTLSELSSRIYKSLEDDTKNVAVVSKFKETLSDMDESLEAVYDDLFKDMVEDISRLGGMSANEIKIKFLSALQDKEILDNNTIVKYSFGEDEDHLPEHHNGLGYMNLLSMIFEIKILVNDFKKGKDEKSADINLLFIEEPEAHTHPQMQKVFIKNIKNLLKGSVDNLQTIMSTHSSHIVSESHFDDIKYFKHNDGTIFIKNLKDLESEYKGEEQYYKFLKQYLTIHRAELFFADKAIFIEGDTERILLPAMMKKIDQEYPDTLPLLSQHVSIIDMGGNLAKIFEKFIDFLGVKSVVITDIDFINEDGSCSSADAKDTSNHSLRNFYGDTIAITDLKEMPLNDKILKKQDGAWKQCPEGHLLFVYQTEEKNINGNKYHARSFEDAFFHINKAFFESITLVDDDFKKGKFPSLKDKYLKPFLNGDNLGDKLVDAYRMANCGVYKKPGLAMDVLLHSETIDEKDFINWHIPAYIKEGLKWLKDD